MNTRRASASFKLLVAKCLGQRREFFQVESYRVIIERHGEELLGGEATVKVKVAGASVHTVAESTGPDWGLDQALRLALDKPYPATSRK